MRPIDATGARRALDSLAVEVTALSVGGPEAEVEALRGVLGGDRGFVGDRRDYDHPDNSMLDLVLERRRGLPILLSVVYVEVARRARIPLAGVGLPGHFVVGHFARVPPLLLDPFNRGVDLDLAAGLEVEPWTAHATALRMLNNLVASYRRRADLGRALRAAEMRLALPLAVAEREFYEAELGALRVRLN